MLVSLTLTILGAVLLVGAGFAHDLTSGLMALGGVLVLAGLLAPERKGKL